MSALRAGRLHPPLGIWCDSPKGVHSPTPDTGRTNVLPLQGLSSKPQTRGAISLCSQQASPGLLPAVPQLPQVFHVLRAPRPCAWTSFPWKLLHLVTSWSSLPTTSFRPLMGPLASGLTSLKTLLPEQLHPPKDFQVFKGLVSHLVQGGTPRALYLIPGGLSVCMC